MSIDSGENFIPRVKETLDNKEMKLSGEPLAIEAGGYPFAIFQFEEDKPIMRQPGGISPEPQQVLYVADVLQGKFARIGEKRLPAGAPYTPTALGEGRVLFGPEANQITIGRHDRSQEDKTMVIPETYEDASRNQATLKRAPEGGFVLQDHSRNGTDIIPVEQLQPLDPYTLKSGEAEVINLGNSIAEVTVNGKKVVLFQTGDGRLHAEGTDISYLGGRKGTPESRVWTRTREQPVSWVTFGTGYHADIQVPGMQGSVAARAAFRDGVLALGYVNPEGSLHVSHAGFVPQESQMPSASQEEVGVIQAPPGWLEGNVTRMRQPGPQDNSGPFIDNRQQASQDVSGFPDLNPRDNKQS